MGIVNFAYLFKCCISTVIDFKDALTSTVSFISISHLQFDFDQQDGSKGSGGELAELKVTFVDHILLYQLLHLCTKLWKAKTH